MSLGDRCVRCPHLEQVHDAVLGYCLEDSCPCLQFVSEADEAEASLASGDTPEPLDFEDER